MRQAEEHGAQPPTSELAAIGQAAVEPDALWQSFDQHVCELIATHRVYSHLYGNRETVDRMNKITGPGFRIIQGCFHSQLIRLIAALTDPPSLGTRQNASIRHLMQTMAPDDAGQIEKQLQALQPALETIRAHRNKRMMHFDVPTVTGAEPLPRLLADHLDAAIKGIAEIAFRVSVALGHGNRFYDMMMLNGADAALSWMISDCIRYAHLRRCSQDPDLPDATLRRMVRSRSGRADPTEYKLPSQPADNRSERG